MIILTTGGTSKTLEKLGLAYADVKTNAKLALEPYGEVGNYLVVGGANGWDEICRTIWHYDFQLPYVVVPAAWDRIGRAAGPARNIHMVRGNSIAPYGVMVPDVVVVGPGDRGTWHCRSEAEKAGIEVIEYAPN